MASSSQPKILLTGATGYIGGTILTHLTQSSHASIKDATITCLVRGEDRLQKLRDAYGSRVDPVLYDDLDDTERTIQVAAEHDVVINTTLGFHPASAAALVDGLARRKQTTGRDVWMIHTSGTSNLADQPISRTYVHEDGKVFNDARDDIYAYEQSRDALAPYPQRTAELGVIDAGLARGVRTLVIMSPAIYGRGTGRFHTRSMLIPALLTAARKHGQAVVVADGRGEWDNVHVADLAALYELALRDILSPDSRGARLPTGKKGIVFSGTRRHRAIDVARGVAHAAHDAGLIATDEVRSVSLAEAAGIFQYSELMFELGICSFSRTESEVARTRLGWEPTRGEEAWESGFKEEVEADLAEMEK